MKVKAIVRVCGWGLGTVVVALTGCVSPSPAARFEALAKAAGLQAGEVAGKGFRHRTFSTTPGARGGRLVVYFGSDGLPFAGRDAITRDPTPRRPLTLALLSRGPQPAVLLGRPCYHGLMAGCQPELWTVGRYSEPVVASMTVATRRLIESGGHDGALLIGYSGGGALALLVAERLELVHAVVTLAANLDIDAWTTLHGYSPLATSINPVTVAGTRIGLRHRHLTGAEDGNVPPVVQRRLMEQLPADSFRTVAGFDHRCCWVERWPELLTGVERGLDGVP